ncbi:hypothetical protein Cni_G18024 [Canna indica]|uniref:Uncharacterized protein n=1 Tax=Canna indica TaxID=4628 RepID=A0AAQ3QH52_9LILI|nr:hypothetical protein Cni_G18024 [Canna indica]
MKPLGCLGIGLSIVSGCLLLALVAELYYFFWWKKRRGNADIERQSFTIAAVELPYLLCWKKPCFLSPAALNPQEIRVAVNGAARSDDGQLKPFGGDDSAMDAELMSLAGHPRSLFTIEEETQEDLESEDKGSRKGTVRKSLGDLLLSNETPLSSPPLFSPPRTPMGCYKPNGFNPLFEPSKEDGLAWAWSSPPPTFKFLKDAEEKLYRKTLMEEALKVERSCRHLESKGKKEASAHRLPHVTASSPTGTAIGKNSSSQVTPLPSSPSNLRQVNGKPCSIE